MMRVLYEEEGNGFLGLSVEPNLDVFVLHVDLKSWSVSEFKRYLKIFSYYLNVLRDIGIKEVYGICDSEKELKFNELFGFRFTGFKVTDTNGVESYLSRLEL